MKGQERNYVRGHRRHGGDFLSTVQARPSHGPAKYECVCVCFNAIRHVYVCVYVCHCIPRDFFVYSLGATESWPYTICTCVRFVYPHICTHEHADTQEYVICVCACSQSEYVMYVCMYVMCVCIFTHTRVCVHVHVYVCEGI